ncbi:MAG: flagellin [Thermoplasmatales archaeon]|nr:flagellin [Thermoplasmatales archaeon]
MKKMGKNISRILKEKDVGSIGIGAMIVFIAMVLVAGIAASVLIQTSTTLESQALATGRETTAEVASGLSVVKIMGNKSSSTLEKLAIVIRPRAGSEDIDLAQTIIEISDSSTKNFLTYDGLTYTPSTEIAGNLFRWQNYTLDATHFSIIVLEDADNSCSSATSAVINSGDYVVLGINVTQCFGGLSPRDDVWGMVIPEEGSPGIINFKCPPSFTDTIMELQ